jgi:hypothetical protein
MTDETTKLALERALAALRYAESVNSRVRATANIDRAIRETATALACQEGGTLEIKRPDGPKHVGDMTEYPS